MIDSEGVSITRGRWDPHGKAVGPEPTRLLGGPILRRQRAWFSAAYLVGA
jgi:hypothetical protein